MNNSENRYANETLKLVVMVLLSYLVPIVGMAFSVYVLIYSKNHPVDRWLPKLAVVPLILQLMIMAVLVARWLPLV